MRRVGGERLLIRVLRRFGIQRFQYRPPAEPVFGEGFRRFPAVDHAEDAVGQIDLEREQILPGIGLPAAAAFLHDDAVADRADAAVRTAASLSGQMAAQLASASA